MPLRVKCPNGCVFRMPASRAGKIVRCPKCKKAIRIARVADSHSAGSATRFVSGNEFVNDEQIDVVIHSEEKRDNAPKKNSSEVRKIEIDSRSSQEHIVGRIQRSKTDRVLLSRIVAVFIILVGTVNLAPAVYHWFLWSQNSVSFELPRWTYIQIFIASLHIIYAILILQISDWSSLRAVSIVMLIFAAVFGFVSAGLVLGGANSPTVVFLGLQFTMIKTATIWCIAMLLLAIITGYLTARESINWQRIEQILDAASPKTKHSG